MTSGWKVAFALVAAGVGSTVCAQEMTVADLKSKGATVLSADEVKGALIGANQSYENTQFITQMTLKADGSLNGTSRRRVGGSGQGTMFQGKWNITEAGQFCAETESFGPYGGNTKYCRSILKLQDKYYYAQGNPKNDARPVVEMNVSK